MCDFLEGRRLSCSLVTKKRIFLEKTFYLCRLNDVSLYLFLKKYEKTRFFTNVSGFRRRFFPQMERRNGYFCANRRQFGLGRR